MGTSNLLFKLDSSILPSCVSLALAFAMSALILEVWHRGLTGCDCFGKGSRTGGKGLGLGPSLVLVKDRRKGSWSLEERVKDRSVAWKEGQGRERGLHTTHQNSCLHTSIPRLQTCDNKIVPWSWKTHTYAEVLGPEGWCNADKPLRHLDCLVDGRSGPLCDILNEQVGAGGTITWQSITIDYDEIWLQRGLQRGCLGLQPSSR